MSLPVEIKDSVFSLQIQKLKEHILIGKNGHQMQSVMFATMGTGHGVSTVCSNLAHELSTLDNSKVLLVDCNNTYPDSKTDMEKAFQKPLINNLFVLRISWEQDTNRWAQIKEQIEVLQKQFTYILFDMPSVVDVPEVLRVVPLVDLVLIVLQSNTVKWQIFNKVKESIEEAQPNSLGVILNKKKRYIPDRVYRRL